MQLRATSFSSTIAVVMLLTLAVTSLPALCEGAPAEFGIWQLADGNQRFSVSGTVTSVDYASNTVTVKTGGQKIEVFVTPTTVIEEHGEAGSIADIRKGAKIAASGVVRNGQKIALSITLK
jgi:hypothetical protein